MKTSTLKYWKFASLTGLSLCLISNFTIPHAHSVAPRVLDRHFPCLVKCVIYDFGLGKVCHLWLWPWPIYWSHSTIKLLKYGTSCCVYSAFPTLRNWFFPYMAQMMTSMRGVGHLVTTWPWHVSSNTFWHHCAIKLLRNCTSCSVQFVTLALVDRFASYVITSTRGCSAHNNLSPWPVSSWSIHLAIN